MSSDILKHPIQYIKGVGPQRAKQLKKLGIQSIDDALFYLPYRYEDRSSLKKISQLVPGRLVTVKGEVAGAELIRTRKRNFTIFELTVSDGSGIIKAKWFNQPFLKKAFKPGQKLFLSGTIKINPYLGIGFEMENPEYEFIDDSKEHFIHTSRLVPLYRTTSGLGQKTLRATMYYVIQYAASHLQEYLPPHILKNNALIDFSTALRNIHFPEQSEDFEKLNAGMSEYHRRLIFDELFLFQLGVMQIKKGLSEAKGIGFTAPRTLSETFYHALPFPLTRSQESVTQEIFHEMALQRPMNRLVQGDVGSGKTVVAVLAMLRAVESGYQAAMMAPTEILAQQHYSNIMNLLGNLEVTCALLTSKSKRGEDAPDIVIGTHALIQEKVHFRKLGLVIIDEQHRFGVRQRTLLRKKGVNPDVLVMTATPIPRTLAMTVYGDMDYSCINELPPGRTPVETKVIPESHKSSVYDLIKREIKEGGQTYVVYPIIEDESKINLRSAQLGKEALGKIFPKFRIELIHGRMKPDDRQAIMDEFKNGAIDMLVSTTVIEVGVDVPNANVMVIVHAERFGLSQLHQLRGRVGRGKRKSFCVLLAYGKLGEDAGRRLAVMAKTTDGFAIAEEDLQIRGPGDFFGTKQSGMPALIVANLMRDRPVVELSRKEAFQYLENDPFLEKSPLLRKRVNNMWKDRIEHYKTA